MSWTKQLNLTSQRTLYPSSHKLKNVFIPKYHVVMERLRSCQLILLSTVVMKHEKDLREYISLICLIL
jgi:hypothetical protein